MFIQTEETPNPQSLKFLPGQVILGAGTLGMDIPNKEAASQSPLAQSLFNAEGVHSIFLGSDFITITKTPDADWHHIKPVLLGAIADFLAAGLPIIIEEADAQGSPAGSADDYEGEAREIVEQIIELIDTRVRPAVARDGGDIIFHKFVPDNGIVYLTMHGACAGCPSSTLTLKSGIENLLKHYVPEITSVEAVM
ncbi:MAG: NifU family protein [bacterium]